MWIFFLPFAVIAVVALVIVGFSLARARVARGPHPDDMRGIPE